MKQKEGIVYMLYSEHGTKIGMSKYKKKRTRYVKTQLPFDTIHVHEFFVPNRSAIEAYLHEQWRHRRLNGEWFDLSLDEICSVWQDLELHLDEEYYSGLTCNGISNESSFRDLWEDVQEAFNKKGVELKRGYEGVYVRPGDVYRKYWQQYKTLRGGLDFFMKEDTNKLTEKTYWEEVIEVKSSGKDLTSKTNNGSMWVSSPFPEDELLDLGLTQVGEVLVRNEIIPDKIYEGYKEEGIWQN